MQPKKVEEEGTKRKQAPDTSQHKIIINVDGFLLNIFQSSFEKWQDVMCFFFFPGLHLIFIVIHSDPSHTGRRLQNKGIKVEANILVFDFTAMSRLKKDEGRVNMPLFYIKTDSIDWFKPDF